MGLQRTAVSEPLCGMGVLRRGGEKGAGGVWGLMPAPGRLRAATWEGTQCTSEPYHATCQPWAM